MEYKEPIPKQDYKVLVRCFTFNQSKYIEDALNGFVMQKTNFPYICTIVDDCSTDGEQEVIKAYLNKEFDMSVAEYYETEYANITIAPHKTNPNCTFAVYFLKYNHYSKKQKKGPYLTKWRERCKYEALCEGDDYWITSFKLQKQADYMDAHPDCSLCFHNAVWIWENKDLPSLIFNDLEKEQDVTIGQLVDKWIIPTASMMYRPDKVKRPEWANKIYSGDLTMSLLAYSNGTVHFLKDVMCIYRKNDGGLSEQVSTNKNAFALRQQQLLYEEFNKHTNYKYADQIQPVYDRNKRMLNHIDRKNKGGLIKLYSYLVFEFQKHILKNV